MRGKLRRTNAVEPRTVGVGGGISETELTGWIFAHQSQRCPIGQWQRQVCAAKYREAHSGNVGEIELETAIGQQGWIRQYNRRLRHRNRERVNLAVGGDEYSPASRDRGLKCMRAGH